MQRPAALARQARLSFKSVFPWPDPASYVANVVVRPVLTVALLSLAGKFALGDEVAESYVVGGATFAASWSISGGIIQGFYTERARSTLPVLFTATGNRLQMYVSRAILHVANGILSIVVTLAAALLIVGWAFDAANWPGAIFSFAIILLSVTSFSLFLGNLAIMFRDWIVVRATGQMLLMSFSGAFVPRAELPPGLDRMGLVLPLTHGLQGLRQALGGAPFQQILQWAGQETLIAVMYACAGYFLFRFIEMEALRRGHYEAS